MDKKYNNDKLYVFPDYCRIEKVSEMLTKEAAENEGIDGEYMLFNKRTKGIFSINASTKFFLDKFEKPISLFSVAGDIEDGILPEGEINPDLEKFFSLMLKRHFLAENGYTYTESDENSFGFNGYSIVQVLKTSNYEVVSIAEDIKRKRKVVLKFLKFNDSANEQIKSNRRQYFQREFEIMGKIPNNQYICRLLDFLKEEDLAVIEFIGGNTLKKEIEDNNLTLKEKISIIYQIAEAISHLHKNKIIHGDIHANQFILKSNNKIKLIDFGLSVNDNEDEEIHKIRKGGVHYYLEPENILPSAFTNITDYYPNFSMEVYRLGVLFYLILYGKYPFSSFSWKKLCHVIKNEDAVIPDKTNSGEEIPQIIRDVIKKSLSKNPQLRFKSAIEINNVLSGQNYE